MDIMAMAGTGSSRGRAGEQGWERGLWEKEEWEKCRWKRVVLMKYSAVVGLDALPKLQKQR